MTQELIGAVSETARTRTYLIYRQRVVEEDALIDNRMSWFLAAQPTFLAGFVLLFPISATWVGLAFLAFLCLAGVAVTVISQRSVNAAKAEIEALDADYLEALKGLPPHSSPEAYPRLIGRDKRHKVGHTLPTILPYLFYCLWGALLVGAACVFLGWLDLGPDGITLITHL